MNLLELGRLCLIAAPFWAFLPPGPQASLSRSFSSFILGIILVVRRPCDRGLTSPFPHSCDEFYFAYLIWYMKSKLKLSHWKSRTLRWMKAKGRRRGRWGGGDRGSSFLIASMFMHYIGLCIRMISIANWIWYGWILGIDWSAALTALTFVIAGDTGQSVIWSCHR